MARRGDRSRRTARAPRARRRARRDPDRTDRRRVVDVVRRPTKRSVALSPTCTAWGRTCFGAPADRLHRPACRSTTPRRTIGPTFYVTRRLEPYLRHAVDQDAMPASAVEHFDRLAARIEDIAGPPEPPARIHGDLWRGNVLASIDGRTWVIDPAAHGGHRETDLAMMRLFGGFGSGCYAAYAESLPAGRRARGPGRAPPTASAARPRRPLRRRLRRGCDARRAALCRLTDVPRESDGMRFAIKTSPQHTTFADMLAVWQAADDIDVFESGWTFDHFYPIFSDHTGPCLEGWVTHDRARAGDQAPAGRRARDRQRVPASGGAREHGRQPRRDLEWPPRVRHRRRVEPAGVRRVRHRPSAAARALRHVRRGGRGDRQALHRHDGGLRGQALPTDRGVLRAEAGAASASADRHRRRRREAHAAHRGPLGPALERSRRRCRRVQSTSTTCCARIATTIGRDVSEITTSTHLRLDPSNMDSVVEEAEAFAEAGLDLGIVYLPPPHTPAVLEPLAKALAAARRLIPVDDPADPRLADFQGLRLREDRLLEHFVVEGYAAVAQLLQSPYVPRPCSCSTERRRASNRWSMVSMSRCTSHPSPCCGRRSDSTCTAASSHRPNAHRGRVPTRCSTAHGPSPCSSDSTITRTSARCSATRGRSGSTPCCSTRRPRTRSTAGASACPWATCCGCRSLDSDRWPDGIEEMQDAGFTVVALTPSHDALLDRRGRRVETRPRSRSCSAPKAPDCPTTHSARADMCVRIPMEDDVDSVNVATAAAIAFHRLSPHLECWVETGAIAPVSPGVRWCRRRV